MKKNLLIRSDSSSIIGTGHVMRDLVFAQQYKDYKIIFAAQNLSGNINYKVEESGYHVEVLKTNNLEELLVVIRKHNIDMIVIDNYNIDWKYEQKIKMETGITILSFDDTYEKHHCDILLNHNLGANKKKYKDIVPPYCELRCGVKYTLLRDEFLIEKNKVKDKNKNIFISMGGSDSSNLTPKILKQLKRFKNIRINICTTDSNENLKELKALTKGVRTLKLHINSTKIAKLMNNSDLAIITPSVIANEIYFLNIPFIAIKESDNQNEIYKYLKKKKYSVLKKYDDKKLHKKLAVFLENKK